MFFSVVFGAAASLALFFFPLCARHAEAGIQGNTIARVPHAALGCAAEPHVTAKGGTSWFESCVQLPTIVSAWRMTFSAAAASDELRQNGYVGTCET